MRRIHYILPSVALGAAALLGTRAATGTFPLGLERAGSSLPAVTTPAAAPGDAERLAAIAEGHRRLDAALRRPDPALPALPPVVSRSAAAGAPVTAAMPPARGQAREEFLHHHGTRPEHAGGDDHRGDDDHDREDDHEREDDHDEDDDRDEDRDDDSDDD